MLLVVPCSITAQKKSYEQALSMGILTQDKIGPNLSNKKGAVKTVP